MKRSNKSALLVFMVSFVALKSFAQLVPGPSEPHEDPPSVPSQPAPYEPPPAYEPQPPPYEPPPPAYEPPPPAYEPPPPAYEPPPPAYEPPPPAYEPPPPAYEPPPPAYEPPPPAYEPPPSYEPPPYTPPPVVQPPAPTPDIVRVTQAFDMVVKDNVIEMQNWRLLADADRGLTLVSVTGEFVQNSDKKVVMQLIVDGKTLAEQVFLAGHALPVAKLNLIPKKRVVIGSNISNMKIKIKGEITINFFQTRIR